MNIIHACKCISYILRGHIWGWRLSVEESIWDLIVGQLVLGVDHNQGAVPALIGVWLLKPHHQLLQTEDKKVQNSVVCQDNIKSKKLKTNENNDVIDAVAND